MHPVRYRIVPRDPHAHLFEIDCSIDVPAAGGQRYTLPSWIPGSYLIREFARHVVAVRAFSGASPVRIDKISKDTWLAAPCTGPLTVRLDVHAYDLSVRTAYLDMRRGYFNGTSVFLCPEGHAHSACIVEIVPPPHPAAARWRVATTLLRDGAEQWGFGTYRAANYDELIDHPVEMSDFATCTFEAGGVTHDVVVTGRAAFDAPRLVRDLARICQWQCDLFGGMPRSRAPFPRYLFQVNVVGDGYGGLEHRSSTSLICSRRDLPAPGVERLTDEYRRFLGLASHEYFHAWNVKRIKPAVFLPYDLAREAYTRQLWAFEGITSYYDDLALLRSGVIDATSYLELVGRTVTGVLRTPGRRMQSVADASLDAWIKYYRPDENTPNANVSYYAKGALCALALDLTLRCEGSSLDVMMRELWRRHGEAGIGVPEDGIRRLAGELAGRDLALFFDAYVDGTDELPLAELLATHGVTLALRPSHGTKDRGGKSGNGEAPRSAFGATWTPELKLQHVHTGGAAQSAGLAPGDTLVALNGVKATVGRLEAMPATVDPVIASRSRRSAATNCSRPRSNWLALPTTPPGSHSTQRRIETPSHDATPGSPAASVLRLRTLASARRD